MKDATKAILNNYLRTCPWMDKDDLAQEAELVKLEAARHWKPTGGAPIEAYQAKAMIYHLRRYVWDAHWPVYAPVRHLDTNRFDLRGASVAKAARMAATIDHSDERIDSTRAAEMVRDALALLHAGDLAAEVLLAERKPAEVAKARRVPVGQVYRAARDAKRALRENEGLRAFVEE